MVGRWFRRWGVVLLFTALALTADGVVIYAERVELNNSGNISEETWTIKTIGNGISLVSYTIGLIVIQIRASEKKQDRAHRELSKHLEIAAESLFPTLNISNEVRANVMLTTLFWLSIFCSWNMFNKREEKLRWRKGQGCSGTAWQQTKNRPVLEKWKPIVVPDLNKITHSKWKLSKKQVQNTTNLQWVVSTPIFHKSSGKCIGVLNFDGLSMVSQTIFEGEDFPSLCASWADKVAYILEDHGLK